MCMQVDQLYACNHIGFLRVDRCDEFGTKCLGPGGDHDKELTHETCYDCDWKAIARGHGRITNYKEHDYYKHVPFPTSFPARGKSP